MQSRAPAILQHPGGSCGKEGGRVTPHLGGREDDDVLHIPPGEARPHLQHQRDHSRGQGSCSRCPRVTLRAARALLQVPVCCHLPRKRREASVRPLCCAGLPAQVHVALAPSRALASPSSDCDTTAPAHSQPGRVLGQPHCRDSDTREAMNEDSSLWRERETSPKKATLWETPGRYFGFLLPFTADHSVTTRLQRGHMGLCRAHTASREESQITAPHCKASASSYLCSPRGESPKSVGFVVFLCDSIPLFQL